MVCAASPLSVKRTVTADVPAATAVVAVLWPSADVGPHSTQVVVASRCGSTPALRTAPVAVRPVTLLQLRLGAPTVPADLASTVVPAAVVAVMRQ